MKIWRHSQPRPPSRELREHGRLEALSQLLHKLRFWPDLDRTNHRTNFLLGLLVLYAALNAPVEVVHALRGEIGKWMAFSTVALYIFFPMLAPEDLDIPAALMLLIASAPTRLAVDFRNGQGAQIFNLAIACYFFYEHLQFGGGFRRCLTHGASLPITFAVTLALAAPLAEIASPVRYLPYMR